jgi:hypothetical protein
MPGFQRGRMEESLRIVPSPLHGTSVMTLSKSRSAVRGSGYLRSAEEELG